MRTASHRHPAARDQVVGPGPRRRRGVALVFVMVFVIAMAALAMSSIFMASSSTLLAKSYDRERDLRFAAEAALAIGKARINGNPALLQFSATQKYRQLLTNATLSDADTSTLPGIRVNLYVAPTGSSSGQYGRFVSLVAQAFDPRTGYGFIRRLELTQDSFAKYAYWSDKESNSSTTIFFNNHDELWGPVWSNDVINIGSDSATFHDQVGSAKTINGKQYGIFVKPPLERQTPISLPSTGALSTLASYAAVGNMSVTAKDGPTSDETQVRDRIEFLAFDLSGGGDSTGTDEGFYRWYQGNAGTEQAVRGDWAGVRDNNGNPNSIPAATAVDRCGDWHYMPSNKSNPQAAKSDTALKFYPASVHGQTWFHDQILAGTTERGHGVPAGFASYTAYADAEKALTLPQILAHPNARCYMAGDPHLVATDRVVGTARGLPLNGTYSAADVNKGGEDSTFTPTGRYGRWIAPPGTVVDTLLTLRPWDARYLYPVGHTFNPNGKGVIYSTGNVGISGVVNGLVTLYAKGDIVILDDVRYANDPVKGVCHDILGLISDLDIVVADNAINTPVPLSTSSASNYGYRNMDDTKDLYIHAVLMALGTSFRVENYNVGPTNVNDCNGAINGRGCIYLSGGIIQSSRGAVGTSNGTGYTKRYSYDRCAVRNPPPYFPTTGRFQDNRYLELDPVGFKPDVYFQSLSPNP